MLSTIEQRIRESEQPDGWLCFSFWFWRNAAADEQEQREGRPSRQSEIANVFVAAAALVREMG